MKGRLQAMEKETLKKREKQKEAHAKMEKQQLKDRERQLKIKQRREVCQVDYNLCFSDFLR